MTPKLLVSTGGVTLMPLYVNLIVFGDPGGLTQQASDRAKWRP